MLVLGFSTLCFIAEMFLWLSSAKLYYMIPKCSTQLVPDVVRLGL